MNESVSIIILNYNGLRFLKDCFESILSQSFRDFEIIFFDNNSQDGSAKYVRDNFKDRRVRIIEYPENIGFAGGNNEAMNYCKNDLVVLVNNDVKADKDWLKNLVSAMEEKNTIASSYIITEGINPAYYETNGSVSYLMYNVMNIFEKIEDEFYPAGGSLIFRKSEIEVPFDKDYFFYSEDLYLGLKARFMGMKVKFVKNSVIDHFGRSAARLDSKKTFYQERNRILNLFIFFSFSFLIKTFPIVWVISNIKLIISIFPSKNSFRGLFKAYTWFVFHIPYVMRKRREVSKFKKVNETEVIRYMTSKLLNHERALSRFINNVSYYYSRLMGLKPIEYFQKANQK